MARAYRLFRTMGLHHLLVGPSKPPVLGILTRKVLGPLASQSGALIVCQASHETIEVSLVIWQSCGLKSKNDRPLQPHTLSYPTLRRSEKSSVASRASEVHLYRAHEETRTAVQERDS